MRNDNTTLFTLQEGEVNMMASTSTNPTFNSRRQFEALKERKRKGQLSRKFKRKKGSAKKFQVLPNGTVDLTKCDGETASPTSKSAHSSSIPRNFDLVDNSDDDFQYPASSKVYSAKKNSPNISPGRKARQKISVLDIQPHSASNLDEASEFKSRLSKSGSSPKLVVRTVPANSWKKRKESTEKAAKTNSQALTATSNNKAFELEVVGDEDDGYVSESKPTTRPQTKAVPISCFQPNGGYRAGEPKTPVQRNEPAKDELRTPVSELRKKRRDGIQKPAKRKLFRDHIAVSKGSESISRKSNLSDREICDKRVRRFETNLDPSTRVKSRNKTNDVRPVNRFQVKPDRKRTFPAVEETEIESGHGIRVSVDSKKKSSRRRGARDKSARHQKEDRFDKAIKDSGMVASDIETEPEKNERFCELSAGEKEWYDSHTRTRSKTAEPFKVRAANITLRLNDLKTLRGSRWLNDEIINSFAALLNCRNRDFFRGEDLNVRNPTEPMRPRTHMFSSFFFTRLTSSYDGYDYEGVRRWPKRAGVNVKSLDLILFPINLHNRHWVLAAIDLRRCQFMYLDSLVAPDKHDVLLILKRWLIDEIKAKNGAEAVREMGISEWDFVENPENMPHQTDGGSCGVFVLYNADYLELGQDIGFKQQHVRVLRKRTAIFLKKNRLADHPDV